MSKPPFDITLPREAIYQSFKGKPGLCPRCGGPLQQRSQTYLVATRRGRRVADSFMLGGDFGWFCADCPTVVINIDKVSTMLGYGAVRWDVGMEFAVMGIVDLDAVPHDKRHLPLGGDDNPIPLVEFIHPEERAPSSSPVIGKKRESSRPPAPRKRRRR